MFFIILAFCCFFLFGFLALVTNRQKRLASVFGVVGPIAGSLFVIIPAIRQLFAGEPLALKLPWTLPLGSFYLGLDKLSAFFLSLFVS